MSWSLVSGKLSLNKQPLPVSEDHIDVKVSHFSVSSLDSNLISRSESNETHYLGTAAYGTVANVPAKFKGSFAVGDKVGVTVTRSNCSNCRQCAQGRQNLCLSTNGSEKFERVSYYTSHLSANPAWLFSVPRSIPEASVVPLLNEGVLAYSALKRYARPGDSIGVIGGGSLGQLAVAYARALGYNTTLIASKEEISAYDVPEGIETGEDVRKFQLKFHVVLCTAKQLTSETVINQFNTARRGGRFIIVGSSGSNNLELPFGGLVSDQREFVFIQSGSKTDIQEALELASKAKIHPKVQVLPFEKTEEAYQRVGEVEGGQSSVVIQV